MNRDLAENTCICRLLYGENKYTTIYWICRKNSVKSMKKLDFCLCEGYYGNKVVESGVKIPHSGAKWWIS